VLLFPSAVTKKESVLWRWMQQHMPPSETGQMLQSMADVPDDTLAAAVFMLDEGAAAAGSAAPFVLVQRELAAEQQQQQGGAEASSKAAQPRLASSAAGAADTAELSVLLRVCPPAGTADSWQCVIGAHPQGLDGDMLADMIAQAGSSSSSSSRPSPVQSWVLPQLLDEDRPALLVCEPAAAVGSSSVAGDAATAVALVAAAEIAAIEALAARGEAAVNEEAKDEKDGEGASSSSSSSSSTAVQQQLLPWELDEDDEDEPGASQRGQSEVHGESQGQGGEVQGEYDEEDDEEEDADTQWEGQEHDAEEEEEEDEDEIAADDAACVPYMLWLCRSSAAAEQAAAQHSSMLAAAGVRAVTLHAALVQQLVEVNDRGIDIQDKLGGSETSESLEAAEEKKQRVQGWISSAERLLQAVVAAKAEYAAAAEEKAQKSAAAKAAPAEEGEGEKDNGQLYGLNAEAEPDLNLVSWGLYTREPWHICLPKGLGESVSGELHRYLSGDCEDAEAELREDLEVGFPQKLAKAEAVVAAAKQEQQEWKEQREALQQQLDAAQLQLGELYGALSEQLGGAAVVFAEAGVLLEAVESSQGVVGLGSVCWLVADSYRGLGDGPAAAAAAGVDAESDDDEEEQRDDSGYAVADDEGDGYHDRLLQLAKLLPGGHDSDSWNSSDAWQLQDSGQVARLVYITQVRCCTRRHMLLSIQVCAVCLGCC
jgi:hypothetical protein